MWILEYSTISVGVSAIAYLLMRRRRINPTPRRLVAVSFLSVYLLAVVWTIGEDIYLDYRLSTFDRDGDGIFAGPDENTVEQAKAMAAVTNDLGRNLVPITGLVWSLAYASALYVAMTFWLRVRASAGRVPRHTPAVLGGGRTGQPHPAGTDDRESKS